MESDKLTMTFTKDKWLMISTALSFAAAMQKAMKEDPSTDIGMAGHLLKIIDVDASEIMSEIHREFAYNSLKSGISL